MVTLQILGGRKEKIRPGDVLGALTGEAGFTREQVGKITVTDMSTYVAVDSRHRPRGGEEIVGRQGEGQDGESQGAGRLMLETPCHLDRLCLSLTFKVGKRWV